MRNEEFCDFLQISNETEETSTSNWKRKIVNSGTGLNWMHIEIFSGWRRKYGVERNSIAGIKQVSKHSDSIYIFYYAWTFCQVNKYVVGDFFTIFRINLDRKIEARNCHFPTGKYRNWRQLLMILHRQWPYVRFVRFERNGRHCNAARLYSPWILTNRPGVHLVDCYRRKITRDMNVTREIRCESRFINIVSRTWFQWNYIRVSKSVPCIWVMVKSVFRVRCYALILMIDDGQVLETNFHRSNLSLGRLIPWKIVERKKKKTSRVNACY